MENVDYEKQLSYEKIEHLRSTYFPFLEQIRQESIDRLFKVHITVSVEFPHFGAHLHE